MKAQHEGYIKEMATNFDQIASRLKERYEEKNKKLKQVQGTFKEMLENFQREELGKWSQERQGLVDQITELQQQLTEERQAAASKVGGDALE